MADPRVISESYLRLLGIITLVILPVGMGIAAVAEPLVLTALGDKWTEAIPLIAILGLNGAIGATQTNNSAVWLAMGLPREVTRVQGCFLLVLLPALYFFLSAYGMVGVGYAYLLAQTVNVPLAMSATKRLLKFDWAEVAAVIWRPIVGALAMYMAVGYFDPYVGGHAPWLRLIIDAGVGAAAYCAVVVALWLVSARPAGAETFCLQRAKLL